MWKPIRSVPDNLPPHVTAFTRLSEVPLNLQPYLDGQHEGDLEINDVELDFYVAIRRAVKIDSPIYIFYNVSSIELAEAYERYLLLGVAGIGICVLLAGFVAARSVASQLSTPLARLTAEVQDLSLHSPAPSLSQCNSPDELGTLARTIGGLLERVEAFTHREREFTSHASHELRTPATVIKGAAEILETRGADVPGIREPTARIQRAVGEIETLINTFLLLAREHEIPAVRVCELREITEDVVAAHRHLLQGKPVEVDVRASQAGAARVAPAVVSIAVGNLVRNAFMYTTQGQITLQVLADRVVVTNPAGGHGVTNGEGLGLAIVRRLCKRMGWTFTISDGAGGVTHAELIFHSQG
jgi:signal transduction histidine kinase